MHDRLSIYRDESQEWRWRRISDNGNILAVSGEGYSRRIDCDRIAIRVNAQPYIVEVSGEVIGEIGVAHSVLALDDGSAFVGSPEEARAAGFDPIGTATFGAEPDEPQQESRSVPIAVYIGEALSSGGALWTLGITSRNETQVWGLEYAGRMTHMCYDTNHAPPAEAVVKVRERGFDWWYFDVGRELRVKMDDLEAAFKLLGLLDETPAS